MDKPKHRRVVLRANGARNKVTPSDEHIGSCEDLVPRTHFDGLPAMPSPVFTWQPGDVLLTSTPGHATSSNVTRHRHHAARQMSAWEHRPSSSSSGDSDEVFVPRTTSSAPQPDADNRAPPLERSARSRRKASTLRHDKHTPSSARTNVPSTPTSLYSTLTDGSLNSSIHMPLLTSSLRKGGSKPSVDTQWERGGHEELEAYFPDHQVRIFTATWNMHEERVRGSGYIP